MGNFSRDTFDKMKNYVGVRLQMGVPLVDADWNEQEDIHKWELRTFLKWFVGDGVLEGSDGFGIQPSGTNNFLITGGTESNPGRCLVDGMDVMHIEPATPLAYSGQRLYNNSTLAEQWGVLPLPPLHPPASGSRSDLVYLDVWEREVDSTEDPEIVDERIGVETCVRLKREWVVRLLENGNPANLPAPPSGHSFYPLARVSHASNGAISLAEDLRKRNLSLRMVSQKIATLEGDVVRIDGAISGLNGSVSTLNTNITGIRSDITSIENEIRDARGTRANLDNRLDRSLMANGDLRYNSVGSDQIQDNSVTMGKLAPNSVGPSEIKNEAVGFGELKKYVSSKMSVSISAGSEKIVYIGGWYNNETKYFVIPRLNVLNVLDPATNQTISSGSAYVDYYLRRGRLIMSGGNFNTYFHLHIINTSTTYKVDVECDLMWFES